CETEQLSDCAVSQVVNAYDNTIVYTDYILSQIIDLLKAKQDKVIPAMIYLSDHGESLGEYGLYLHSLPYFMAPETQTKVPFITWIPPLFSKAMQSDGACVKKLRDQEYSQDNLFHTVLGAMNVKTKIYRKDLDMFADCRGGNS
ncbi:MAG: sulfatase-like hydrolase/transferase, partial [Hyphomicrobiales bacterium]